MASEHEPFWESTFRGEPISLTWPDITLHRCLEMGATFGEQFGIPAEFIMLLSRGDMRALACAIWISQQKAGGKVDKLGELDFSPADFEAPAKPKRRARKQEDPTGAAEEPSPTDSPSTASES